MGSFVYKGKTSGRRYEWMQLAIPSALLGFNGQPLLEASYNGEILVNANHDGSVAEAVATGPPLGASTVPTAYGASDNDIYSAYVLASLWEQGVASGGGGGGGGGGFGSDSFGGGAFGG